MYILLVNIPYEGYSKEEFATLAEAEARRDSHMDCAEYIGAMHIYEATLISTVNN